MGNLVITIVRSNRSYIKEFPYFIHLFFISCLAIPRPSLGPYQRKSVTRGMLITGCNLCLTFRSPGAS